MNYVLVYIFYNHKVDIVKIISQKSPQVVKHVVKGGKWACSTLKAGKNKPIDYIAKTRDFKRFSEKIKEKRGFGWTSDFGLSDKTWTCAAHRRRAFTGCASTLCLHSACCFTALGGETSIKRSPGAFYHRFPYHPAWCEEWPQTQIMLPKQK